MKLYAHFDEREPAHTEVLEFDGSSDIPFELVRALFVDAYNAKHAPARLDPQALLPTDELGVARHPLGGSIFDALNEGDDLFFASGAGGTVASLKEEIQAGGAAPQPLAKQIAELKEQIKRATDEGQYDLLAPLAQQIKALEEEQQAKAAVPLPAPAVAPANPIEASRAAAGEHSHYYWDKQAKGAPEPKATPVRTKCGHWFCEACVLKSKYCAVCKKSTNGIFSYAKGETLAKLMERGRSVVTCIPIEG